MNYKTLFAALILAAAPAFAAVEPGYSHEFSMPAQPAWMAGLPDSLKLSHMSLPGTHDSMSRIGGDAVATQTLDLHSQLAAGIRVLDVRILFTYDTFLLCHGVVKQPGTFDDVMQTLEGFLAANPRETVLMRIRDEHDGDGNTQTFEKVFARYWDKYANVFWQSTGSETNPTLGELRGKVVVLQNFAATRTYGLSYSLFQKQDDYDLSSNWDLYNKWSKIKDQLGLANLVGKICPEAFCPQIKPGNEDILYMNFLSGATGAFPYFVASGKSDPSTGGPLLATGRTTPGWSSWPDFPRINCFGAICTIAFEGTNNMTFHWLVELPRRRVGIVMADFPGLGLIQQIVALNRNAATAF